MKPTKEVLVWLGRALRVDGEVVDALFLGDDHFSIAIKDFDGNLSVKHFHLSED